MKALFIGGTGTISTAIVKRLVNELGWEVWLLNRGNRTEAVPDYRGHSSGRGCGGKAQRSDL